MLSTSTTVVAQIDRRDLVDPTDFDRLQTAYGELVVDGHYNVRLQLPAGDATECSLRDVVVTLRRYDDETTQKLTLAPDEIDAVIEALTEAKAVAR